MTKQVPPPCMCLRALANGLHREPLDMFGMPCHMHPVTSQLPRWLVSVNWREGRRCLSSVL